MSSQRRIPDASSCPTSKDDSAPLSLASEGQTERTNYPAPPAALHADRGRWLRTLGRGYLRLAGWRIAGTFPDEPKFVAIVAPHTSNWDFPLSVAVFFALELRVSWLAKHSMFFPPFKQCLRWLGGIPINRNASHRVVGQCVQAFAATPALMLALAPEGTRKGVSQWKSGFYRIAAQAGVPIMPVGFDYREHVIHLMPLFRPGGNLEQDLPLIQARFSNLHGHRERSAKDAAD